MRTQAVTRYRRLETQCDMLVQLVSQKQAGGRCALGNGEGTVGHHLIGRANKVHRHEPLNVLWVSQDCHDLFHGIITDRNRKMVEAAGIVGIRGEIDRTMQLLKLCGAGAREHMEYWLAHRYGRSHPVWEIELERRRDALRKLLR